MDRRGPVSADDPFADTYHWAEYDVELAAVLSEKMLVNQVVDRTMQNAGGPLEHVRIYLCYNWKLKTEFILVHIDIQTILSEYTPQYGRDDNYRKRTQTDTKFLAFAVDAFKREKPDLATCLDLI
jgi:hypothetical protein